MSEYQAAAQSLASIDADLYMLNYPRSAELTAALRTIDPLVKLGRAVLEEHRTALLAERDLTNPQAQQDAKASAEYVRELLA